MQTTPQPMKATLAPEQALLIYRAYIKQVFICRSTSEDTTQSQTLTSIVLHNKSMNSSLRIFLALQWKHKHRCWDWKSSMTCIISLSTLRKTNAEVAWSINKHRNWKGWNKEMVEFHRLRRLIMNRINICLN